MFNTICHVEWYTTDFEVAKRFYGALFGWTFRGETEEEIFFCTDDGKEAGGFSKRADFKRGESPHAYVWVEDVEASLAKAVELGGGETLGKTEVPGFGWYARITDPDGNPVGLWQSLNPEKEL